MQEILTIATILAPIVTAVTELLKRAFRPHKRYTPLVAVAVGILLGAAAYFVDAELLARMWAGGVAGLAATGLFELGKNVKEKGGE